MKFVVVIWILNDHHILISIVSLVKLFHPLLLPSDSMVLLMLICPSSRLTWCPTP